MKYLTLILLLVLTSHPQPETRLLEGVYRLRNDHEMVAEFHFTAAGRFEFAFSYGAVDRGAEGSYTIDNHHIILHSDKTPGKDFDITHSERKGTGFTIQISDPNPWFRRDVICIFKKGDKYDQRVSNEDGIAHSTMTECDSIFVGHNLFPDVMTVIKDPHDTTNNHFELTPNVSLVYLSFKDVSPRIDKDTITVEMPALFGIKEAIFEKIK